MNEKTLQLLEFPKIRAALAGHTHFSASHELALKTRPTRDIALATLWLKQTTEARLLLATTSDLSLGGLTDIRGSCSLASRGGVLSQEELLEIKNSLIVARTVLRAFEKIQTNYASLALILQGLEIPVGLIDSISRCVTDRGDISDNASEQLGSIRREIKVCHERLLGKLERIINDTRHAPMLQEAIITQRDGRYVIPLRSEFKGQLKSIIHDQSSSGATLFVEPLAVVELNNQYREIQLSERDEERRILAELSTQVGLHAEAISGLIEVFADLDVILARARYADYLTAVEPILVPFHPRKAEGHPGSTIQLIRARHPLLDPGSVVPIDLELDNQTYALIITGPNTGGKTVTLKTVGLLAVMAQSGLHIPALSGSKISVFDHIFADIGDEQSIEQSLSTFSGHITNIILILKKADNRSLVLLDELGAGTDPQEGAALAMAIVKHLLERRVTTMVATHYPELKTFAHNTQGVINASLEFDLETLEPTYYLSLGLPGRSNALAIAERLGLSDEIIRLARTAIHPDELRAEDLLEEIYQQRKLAREARAEAEQLALQNLTAEKSLRTRLEKIEDERLSILETARKQVEEETYLLRQTMEDIRKDLARAHQPLEIVKATQDKLDQVEESINQPAERKPVSNTHQAALRLGSKVMVAGLGMEGVITSLGEEEAEVQVGRLRMRARLTDLRASLAKSLKEEAVTNIAPLPSEPKKLLKESPKPTGLEIDLRGERAEDALDRLDRYLSEAYSSGLPFVRVIHGKGTGRLRQVIRETLRQNTIVDRFDSGMDNEGGDGVTVIHLKTD